MSSAQASDSVCLPSLPPMATRNLFATSASVCAYLALGPGPCTMTLHQCRVPHGLGSLCAIRLSVRADSARMKFASNCCLAQNTYTGLLPIRMPELAAQ